ncbi:phage tail tape measure protein [bacterium]|nr:phage tail tape measure protein [bacterium]
MAKLNNDKISVELDLRATKAQEEIHRLTRATQALKEQNKEYRREITALTKQEGDHSAEFKRLNEAIAANTREIEKNNREIKKQESSVDLSRKSASELRKELKQLKAQQDRVSKSLYPEKWKELNEQIKAHEKALKDATAPSTSFLDKLKQLPSIAKIAEGALLAIGVTLVTKVTGAFRDFIGTIMNFEKANSKLAAVLGTNIQGISSLTEQAKLLGRTTTATASDVTQLQTELAKLGFVADDIEKLTPATLRFAKAVDTDLGSAAAFAGAAMRMFGKDTSEAESVMATFAVATTSSALDFQKLQASLSTVGPVAASFGFTVEETTALLGQLSNAGFDASSAATATRNILLSLADSNGDLAKALGGPVKNLDDMVKGLKNLNAAGVDLNTALELTDKRSVAAFSTFLSEADNIGALRDSITDCTEDFKQMATTMGDNAAGSAAGLESAVEGLVLKFFDFRTVLSTLFQWATNLVNAVGDWIDAFSGFGVVLKGVGAAVLYVLGGVGSFLKFVSDLVTKTALGRAALNGAVTAFVAYKVAALLASQATRSFVTDIYNAIKAVGAKITAMMASAKADGLAAVATRAWNAALMANPIMLVVGLIATLTAAIIGYNSASDGAKTTTDAWTEASREASRQYGEQRGKIEALIMVAENENLSLERRRKAIDELNRIIPGYNASIDETTGKYDASREALDKYLDSLEKELRLKAHQDKLEKLAAEEEAALDAADDAKENAENVRRSEQKNLSGAAQRANRNGANFRNNKMIEADNAAAEAQKNYEEKKAATEAYREKMKKRMESGELATPEESEPPKANPVTLPGDKNKKGAKTPGTYGEDSLAKYTKPLETEHKKNVATIEGNNDASNIDKSIAKAREQIRYALEIQDAMAQMRAETDATHTKTLDEITAKEAEAEASIAAAEREIEQLIFQQDLQTYDDRLKATEAFYEHQKMFVLEAAAEGKVTMEQSQAYALEMERQATADRLRIVEEREMAIYEATSLSEDERTKMLEQAAAERQKLQQQELTQTAKYVEMIREMQTNADSAEGIAMKFDRLREQLSAEYDAVIAAKKAQGEDTEALESEHLRRIAALNYQQDEAMRDLKANAGTTWADEYERELASLKNMHDQGLISEQEYQKKRLQAGVNNAKKYFDYYSGLATSMFSAMQDAEIAESEAKYDVLIQQAKNNGEDTTALEEQKENEKLKIQKKYADVNFAIKVADIIANTAQAIMTAFAQLGPIGGGIAAAMLTATGAMQVKQAKAERDRVKNMQPSHTSTGSVSDAAASATSEAQSAATKSTQRTLTGYSDGGYTGDGDRYEVAGVVHRGEYVVPKPIMNNPRVINAVGMIEAIRRHKIVTSGTPSAPGFADGGFTDSTYTVTAADLKELAAAIKELRAATDSIRSVRAYVVYKDVEEAKKKLNAASSVFSKG